VTTAPSVSVRSRPRVTIVIATFNYAPILRTAIASVRGQSFQNWELRVVGDACTDESASVVASFGDPRIHWSNLPVNTGFQSGPNNAGIAQARGDLVAYLSHDDLWLPHHLSCAVAEIDRGADLAYGMSLRIVPGRRRQVSRVRVGRKPRLVASQVVHRADLIDRVGHWRFPRELNRAPGRDLWTRMQEGGARLVPCRRITVVKFPARHREAVYRDRPIWEQTHWLGRIHSERDFELRELLARLDRRNRSREAKRLLKIAWRIARDQRRWSMIPSLTSATLRVLTDRRGSAKQRRGNRAGRGSYADRIAAKRRFNGVGTT
jgi:glycosyltransferase involved in cell wall biosynthesis